MSLAGTQRKDEAYYAGKLEAARVIADPVKYPPGSLPAIWAELILHDSQEGKR